MRIITFECLTKDDLPTKDTIKAVKARGDQIIVKVHSDCYDQHFFTDKGINFSYSIGGYYVDKIIYVDGNGKETVLKDRQEEKKEYWRLSTKTNSDGRWFINLENLGKYVNTHKEHNIKNEYIIESCWLTEEEYTNKSWRRYYQEVSHKGF